MKPIFFHVLWWLIAGAVILDSLMIMGPLLDDHFKELLLYCAMAKGLWLIATVHYKPPPVRKPPRR